MNHRVPHYFTSVPTDNASSQYNQTVPRHIRPAVEQHHHRTVHQEPQSQWSQAATSSSQHLSHRRFQSTPADVASSDSEDGSVSHFGSYAVASTLGPSDWLGHPSTSTRNPRHQAAGSTTPYKRKHRHSIAARQEAKMRRVYCEKGQTVDPSASSTPGTSSSYLPTRAGGLAYEDNIALRGSQDSLPFPMPQELDGAALRMETSPTSKDPGHSQCVVHPCAYSDSQLRNANPSTSYSQVFPSWQSGSSKLQETGVKVARANDPTRAPSYLENTLVHKHRDYPHSIFLPQNRLLLERADPARLYPRSAHHSSSGDSERLEKGCGADIAKNSVPYTVPVEPENAPPHRVIDGLVSGYHKSSHSCHSSPHIPSTSMGPLPTFPNCPSHLASPISYSEHHKIPLTGRSLREILHFNEPGVTFHPASQYPLAWDANHLKVHSISQTHSGVTDHPYPFPHKSLHESSNEEQFNNAWHAEKTRSPLSCTIPAQTSSSTYSINMDNHASYSRNPFSVTSSCDKIQNDPIQFITNAKTKIPSSPPINQSKESLTSHSTLQHNVGASDNSFSGTLDRRNPIATVSNSSKTCTSSVSSISSPGSSSIPKISNKSEERTESRNRAYKQKDIPELLTFSQKKYKGSHRPPSSLSTGPTSKTDAHEVACNPHRGHCSKMSGESSGRDSIPQLDTSSNHSTPKSNDTMGGTRRRRRHAEGLICGVCGDSARSLHFGGVSCDSCKAFFRRAVIAGAYPSFLCVTTGLPPKIKCQKSGKTDSESSKSLGSVDSRSAPSIKDSVQPESSPVIQHKVQISSSAAFQSVTEDRLSYRDSGRTSVPTYISPGSSSSSNEGRNPSLSEIGRNNSPTEILHPVQVQETVLQNKGSGSKHSQHAARLGLKKIVKCPPITITTRKYCQACRFQRCIDIGMEIGWVTLENDAQKNSLNQHAKSNDVNKSRTISGNLGGSENDKTCDKDSIKKGEDTNFDLNKYLTLEEQKQIEELIDIYRSVFWGVPEPPYNRPAMIDFPPPFALNDSNYDSIDVKDEGEQKPCGDFSTNVKRDVVKSTSVEERPNPMMSTATSLNIRNSVSQPEAASCSSTPETDNNGGHNVGTSKQQCHKIRSEDSENNTKNVKTKPCQSEDQYYGFPSGIEEEVKNLESEMTIEEIINLPKDPLGVNKFRKPLMRRPRPWLIRQLMGYTLRFLNVVLKLLKSAGKSLSPADRTELLRQGMTGLTFLNSVFTYDVDNEGWPERVFPPLPLVLQEEDSGASDQPEYLQGIVMHSDEVASVVPPHVLETQLTFIRGMKALVGNDCTSVILLMAIMLFDPTHEGLEHPKAVEKIQGNYCHLLKQYVAWKFKNGSPPSPGLGRSHNFKPLSNIPQDICDSLKTATSAELVENTEEENKTKPEEFNELPHAKDLPGSSEINEKKKCCDGKNIFKFKRPEGMYFSPPYPQSPTNPASIFPYLMTRMADLKQIAHGYSSSPFLLQGSEVNEIANLVARIEVFMSDIIIATGPGQENNDHGSDGGGEAGGSEGNKDIGDDLESHITMPGDGTGKEEFTGNKSGSRQKIGGESMQYEKLTNDNETAWDGIHGQDFEWDSYSSDDDSNSIESQRAMSIASSFKDLVGVLEADEKELTHLTGGEPGEVLECLAVREKDEPIPYLHETEDYLKSIVIGDEKVQMDVLEINKDINIASYYPNCRYDLQQIKVSHDGGHLEESMSNIDHMNVTSFEVDNSASLSNYFDSHTLIGVSDGQDKGIFNADVPSNPQVKVNQTRLMDREENKVHWERAVRDQSSFILGRDKPSEHFHDSKMERMNTLKDHSTQRKDVQQPSPSCDIMDVNAFPRHEVEHYSLWDRIKATGKALLGLDSSRPQSNQGDFFKGRDNITEHTAPHGCAGDLENWLNPLERPDSNSSGYVSTVSSPPLILNAQRDLESYDSGGDWEDLFQKL